jgi:hypothetical protein
MGLLPNYFSHGFRKKEVVVVRPFYRLMVLIEDWSGKVPDLRKINHLHSRGQGSPACGGICLWHDQPCKRSFSETFVWNIIPHWRFSPTENEKFPLPLWERARVRGILRIAGSRRL